jgi:xanthine dehydrogenase small subunit
MAGPRGEIRFRLNDRIVTLDEVPAMQTLLDFLRLDRKLTGSKEGCAEGDCGACTVLVGRVRGGRLDYEAMTACILFTGALDGCHVVTVEHLAREDGSLHPVQRAMVDLHGSQCGFCTPGIVMSLYALWMHEPHPNRADIDRALQGNLCRCTGYAPIVRAGMAVSNFGQVENDPLVAERDEVLAQLTTWQDGARVEVGQGRDRFILPASTSDLADALSDNPGATIIAGSTDVGLWVTKFMRDIGPLIFVGQIADLQGIEEGADALTLGAGVTYTTAMPVLNARFPQLTELLLRLGGEQVRNMGTIGGNIANGSPIGDTPPPLIALGASVTLNKGGERRDVPLDKYFIAYGKQDRSPGEFIESVTIPYLPEGEQFAVYKISKRRDEDISAVCGAFRVRIDAGTISRARIAFGGMAATPKRAAAVEAALAGRSWSEETILAALPAFAEDFQPLTDVRASAAYRLLSAQNLLRRFFHEVEGDAVRLSQGAA